MSYEHLMQSIAVAQRHAGEQAVIRHLEAQGLVTPAERSTDVQLIEIAKAMQTRYKNAVALHSGRARSANEWDALDDVKQLAWIAAAGEAVAQVVALNATARSRALGVPH